MQYFFPERKKRQSQMKTVPMMMMMNKMTAVKFDRIVDE